MNKIAIMTDSNSGITQKEAEVLRIRVLPMPFLIDGETFFEEISLTQEQFYERLAQDVDISTSQPSPEDVTKAWEELYIFRCRADFPVHARQRSCLQTIMKAKCRL